MDDSVISMCSEAGGIPKWEIWAKIRSTRSGCSNCVAEMLIDLGCEEAQGFLFSRAVDIAAAGKLLAGGPLF